MSAPSPRSSLTQLSQPIPLSAKASVSAVYKASRIASWFRLVRAGSPNRSTSTTMIAR